VDPGRSEDVGVTVGVECPNSEDSSEGFIGSKGIRESVDDGVEGGEFSNESSELLEIFEKTVEFACANACLTVPRVDLLLATVAGLLETFRSTKRRSSSSLSRSLKRVDEHSCCDSKMRFFWMVIDCKGNLCAAVKGEGA
jgi:hypothetical protein